MKNILIFFTLTFLSLVLSAQEPVNFQFALVTDTHLGSGTGAEDLRNTIKDINNNASLSFVILSGDITEFGSDAELKMAKQMLDSLNKPWYIIPGNHDDKWSESGGNSFRRIFGSETFSFVHGNYLFIGTNSGPNMRMSPAQMPRENIVWLDSLLKTPAAVSHRIIYVNHYPQDNSMNNWYEALDRLKKDDIELILCGHGHTDKQFSFEGIPGLMCRSNLRGNKEKGGYNIIEITGDTLLTASDRTPGSKTHEPWSTVRLYNHHYTGNELPEERPDFSMNSQYNNVKETWRVQEKSDIGSGGALSSRYFFTTNTNGEIKAIRLSDGGTAWKFGTGAKIYSTPVLSKNTLVGAATNGKVYALNATTGKLIWSFDTHEPVVASPVIYDDRVFIAGSGGKCYSLLLKNGTISWHFDEVIGFVETIPLIYNNLIIFGTWENRLYALDKKTGGVVWLWHNDVSNRMLSPAACVPVAANNRIFVVSPDRKMTCLDAITGNVIWRSGFDKDNVRESMGLSADKTMIYAKTMDGDVIGISASGNEGKITWRAGLNTGYDIAPGVIVEAGGVVFIPTDKGLIYAADRKSGDLLWKHRISSCLINMILPVDAHSLICTSMDGVIAKISF